MRRLTTVGLDEMKFKPKVKDSESVQTRESEGSRPTAINGSAITRATLKLLYKH